MKTLTEMTGNRLVAGVTALTGLFLLLTPPARAEQRQALQGHVPAAVASLQPLGRLPATNRLVLTIGLPLRDQAELASLLERVCDPASPDYGHYLTPEQFAERFGPAEQDYQALIAFVKTNGLAVTSLHSNRTLLEVSGSVADIEQVFQVTLRVYPHPREARTFYAPEAEPSLGLAVPVLHISGLDNYIVPRPLMVRTAPPGSATGARPAAGSGPGGTYMGNDFRAAYVPGVSNLTGAGQVVGLLEFDGYYPGDITNYVAQAGLPNVPLKTVLLDGFDGTPGSANDEVALDIDMAMSMAPGLSAVVVYEGLLTDSILNRMATDNLAKQLSASWTYSIDASTEQIFQQFAAQGQSFFNASGDSDAYVGSVDPPCDDPYITIVGGTTLTNASSGGAWVSETVWNWGVEYGSAYDGIGSSGGISTTYSIPAYQQGISMSANKGSTTMRNLPDVAMIADYVYLIADNGSEGWVGGTSCAAPLWAGFIALVNQQAVANGRATVGFINPAIYMIGKGANYANCFHDITTGNNAWSGSSNLFHAVTGYDLCTGWGTPKGAGLINALAPSDPLQITPGTGFAAGGPPGGPFNGGLQSYSLTNAGATALNWTLATTASWLSALPSGGTLSPGGPAANVTVNLNAASSNLAVGTYAASVWFTNQSDANAQSRQFTLVVFKPPIITSQPTNLAVLGGATAAFSVAATGWLPLSYQWQDNGTNLTDGDSLYGSATATLTISNVSPANVGTYSVIVSNITGMTTSSNAVLAMTPSAPVITLQPTDQTLLFGATARFTVAALGNAPLFYQWQDNGTNLTDGGNTSGSATSSLTVSNITAASIGTYSVVVSNALGSQPSAGAVLAVELAQPGGPLVQNGGFETGSFASWVASQNFSDSLVSSSAVCVHSGGYGALLGPVGSLGYLSQTLPTLPGATYLLSLWLDSPDGVSPNEFLVAWNGTTLFDQTNIPAIGWTNLQFFVTAAGTNSVVQFGFRDDQSFLGLDDISVVPVLSAGDSPPVIISQPPSQPLAMAGSNVTLSVVAAGQLPLAYQWQFNATNIANATNGTLTLTGLTTNQTGNYSMVVTNALGSTTSSNSALTVLVGTFGLITFDDLTSSLPVPSGYGGLNWSNFYCLNGITASGPSGYNAGVVSSSNVIYDAYGYAAAITNTTPFALLSAYLTAAWDDNLRVEVMGYYGGTLLYDNSYTLSATAPTLINFNYAGVTAVEFIPSGGTPHPGYGGSGTHFVVDNVSVVFPPTNPPVIITQPASLAVWQGSNAAFSVVIDGTPPFGYQWRFNGANITGATSSGYPKSSSYTRTNVQPAWLGNYAVLITNSAGSILSSNAALSLVLPPSISGGPTNVVVGLGLNATFAVTATGSLPLAYQWEFNGTNLDGATTSSLTISNAQAANAGTYAAVVTNLYGTATSSNALLIVQDPFIAGQPQSQTVAAGAGASFGVSAVGTLPLSYQWLKQDLPLVDGGNISGAQTSSLTVSNVQGSDMANYSVVVSNVNGWVVSSNAALLGPFPPVIVTQPAGQKLLAASTASFTVAALGLGQLGFQWQQNGTNLADVGKFTGSATPGLSVSDVQAGEMGSYSVVVSNAYGPAVSGNAGLSLWPLVSWGDDAYGQTEVPGGLSNVVGIAEGHYHSLALKGDGTVAAWGAGATYTKTAPNYGQSAVPAGLSNVVGVAGGYYHSLALEANGTVVAWGAGLTNSGTVPDYGQALVPAALSNVVALAGGIYHSLALKADGTVAAWGAGTTNAGSNPNYGQVLIPAGLGNVVGIAAGAYHSLALKADSTVVAWGAGTTNTGLNPDYGQALIPAGLGNVVAIAAGGFHSLALKSDGTVAAWGAGTTNTGSNPNYGQAQVPAGLSNVVAIAAGHYHSLALEADGMVVAWGADTFGQTNVPSALANVIGVAGHGYHVLVLEGDGRPHLTVQPVSRTLAAGGSVVFTALAVGGQPLSYQWQRNGTNLTDNARITGSQGNSLSVASLSANDAGNYQAVITNSYGSAASAVAGLTVGGPPVFQAVTMSGGTITLQWSATAGLTYQAQYQTNLSQANWSNLSTPITATNNTVTAWDVAPTDPQRFYRVMLLP